MINTPAKHYYPQLDSMRGLSFLAVFFFHAYHPDFGKGFFPELLQFLYNSLDYSIDVFFVLSAFLLTRLGISEYRERGNFSFRNYFLRRALRIWPLYYLLMAFAFIIVPIAASHFNAAVSLPPAGWYLFFISNFYTVDHVYFLRFLWTLSVEEQFYLVLGIALVFFQKHLRIFMGILIGISIAFNVYSVLADRPFYFNTFTYLFDFAAGALAAVRLSSGSDEVEKSGRNKKRHGRLPIFFVLLFVCSFLLQRYIAGTVQDIIAVATRLIFILLIAALIIREISSDASGWMRANGFLVYTGKISYGLYCFHGIVLTLGILGLQHFHIHIPQLPAALLLLAADYLVAALSYRLIERPFLQFKDRLRRV